MTAGGLIVLVSAEWMALHLDLTLWIGSRLSFVCFLGEITVLGDGKTQLGDFLKQPPRGLGCSACGTWILSPPLGPLTPALVCGTV